MVYCEQYSDLHCYQENTEITHHFGIFQRKIKHSHTHFFQSLVLGFATKASAVFPIRTAGRAGFQLHIFAYVAIGDTRERWGQWLRRCRAAPPPLASCMPLIISGGLIFSARAGGRQRSLRRHLQRKASRGGVRIPIATELFHSIRGPGCSKRRAERAVKGFFPTSNQPELAAE